MYAQSCETPCPSDATPLSPLLVLPLATDQPRILVGESINHCVLYISKMHYCFPFFRQLLIIIVSSFTWGNISLHMMHACHACHAMHVRTAPLPWHWLQAFSSWRHHGLTHAWYPCMEAMARDRIISALRLGASAKGGLVHALYTLHAWSACVATALLHTAVPLS